MGFFSKIGSAIKTVATVIKETPRILVESFKEAWNSTNDETSHRTGNTNTYDRDSATIDETARIADILTGFSNGLRGQGEEIEKNAKKNVSDYFDQLYNTMRHISEGEHAVKNLIVDKRMVTSSIDGAFNEILARRVSLSDKECLNILKMPKGSEKESEMKKFGLKVINEGLANLCNNLQNSVNEICSNIELELNDLVLQQKQQLQELVHHLDDITDKRTNDAYNSEEAMLLPAKKLAASDIVLEIIQEVHAA